MHVCLNNGDVPISGVQQKGFDSTLIGWVWLNCPLSGVFYYCECIIGDGLLSIIQSSGVRYSGGSNVLKSMEKRSELSELSVTLWVSAIEGCPLSGVPL